MTLPTQPAEAIKPPVRRKRGGQPGNSNAFKHGFYTQNFTRTEVKGLQAIQGVVLGDEIKLLRVLIKRFAEQIQSNPGMDIEQSSKHLSVISEAMLRLGTLLRIDHMLGGSESSNFIKDLELAIQAAYKEISAGES